MFGFARERIELSVGTKNLSSGAKSSLALPRKNLANCIVLAIMRDTREANLSHAERFNHFFTSPYCALSSIYEGQCHVISSEDDMRAPHKAPVVAPLSFSGPNTSPMVTWSPGPVATMTVGFYPDAWHRLTGMDISEYINRVVPLSEVVQGEVFDAAKAVFLDAGFETGFEHFENALAPLWTKKRSGNQLVPAAIADWVAHLGMRAALGKPGKSARQLQRRLLVLTGQSRRSLLAHARSEELFVHFMNTRKRDKNTLADVAVEAGYADQSHMGREVRRITGASPAQIDRLIASDERYWCYRLLENYYK